MRAPAYYLRPNKAVDRLIFMDAMRILGSIRPLADYTYYGFGGPYLEDFRLLYDSHPEIRMVSIERDREVLKRQRFHLPCGTIQLKPIDLSSFIANYDPDDSPCIFWLDYTDLRYSNFDGLTALLTKAVSPTLVKVTLRATWQDYMNKADRFRQEFDRLMPDPLAAPPGNPLEFALLIQRMVELTAERALPAASGMLFQPVCTFFYSDGSFMLTVAGVVCERAQRQLVRKAYHDWPFASLNWARPKRIDVPSLTTKERLSLQCLLPCKRRAGAVLRRGLGYLIDDTRAKTEARLKQYAMFHRYYPYVMRAIP